MARAIEKGATYLDKLCHKLYDEPKGRGFPVDGKCCRCGGPLVTYYCEDRLHLIVCEKCGTLALTKAVAPQVAANLTLRKPSITPPNEWVSVEERLPEPGERVLAANGSFVGEAYMASNGAWMRHDGFPWEVDAWMPMPDRRPPGGGVGSAAE